MGRRAGVDCSKWLKTWCIDNLTPKYGQAWKKTLLLAMAETSNRNERDPSIFTRWFTEGAKNTGINVAEWVAALETLDLPYGAIDDFKGKCQASDAGEEVQERRFVRFFVSVQARLARRLRRGVAADKALEKAYKEASGLISAWILEGQWFLASDLLTGLPEVVAMSEQWAAVGDSWAEGEIDLAPDDAPMFFEKFDDATLKQYAAKDALKGFLWRLATWLPRATRRTKEEAALLTRDEINQLLRPLHQKLWLLGKTKFIDDQEVANG